jgi:hypothetical protein
MGFQPWLKLGATVLTGLAVVGCQNTNRQKSDPTFTGGPPLKGQQTFQTPPPNFPTAPGAPGAAPGFPVAPGGPAVTNGVGPTGFKSTSFPSNVGAQTPASTTTISKTGTGMISGTGFAPTGASAPLPPAPGGFNTPGLPPAPGGFNTSGMPPVPTGFNTSGMPPAPTGLGGAPSMGPSSGFGEMRTTAPPGGAFAPGGSPNIPPPPSSTFGQ